MLNKGSILLNSLAYAFFLSKKDFQEFYFSSKKNPNSSHGYTWLCAHVFCFFGLEHGGELKAPRSGCSLIALNTLLAPISFWDPLH